MKRLPIPFLFAMALFVNACERHSASSLPSHGAHTPSAEHANAPGGDAQKQAETKTAPKEAPSGAAPKFFEQQPGK
jgi:hypothetical protein